MKSMAVLDCYGAEPRLDVKEDIATLSLLPEEGLTENTCETVLIPQEDVRISLTMNGKKYTYSGDRINVEAAKVTEVNLRVNNLGEKITLTGDVTIKPWEEDGNYDFEFETVDISSSEWTVEAQFHTFAPLWFSLFRSIPVRVLLFHSYHIILGKYCKTLETAKGSSQYFPVSECVGILEYPIHF